MRNLILIIIGCLYISSCSNSYDHERAIDSWETGNETIKLRISSYPQNGIFPIAGSTYHVVESFRKNAWEEIMTVRREDPEIPIDRNGVKCVSNDICFVYSGSGFAVTTDKGNSWTLGDMSELQSLGDINSALIKQVNIRNDGKGEMTVQVYPPSIGPCRELSTTDFGRNWADNGGGRECLF